MAFSTQITVACCWRMFGAKPSNRPLASPEQRLLGKVDTKAGGSPDILVNKIWKRDRNSAFINRGRLGDTYTRTSKRD